MSRLSLAFKALRELGPRQLGLYAWYRLGVRSGVFRRRTKDEGQRTNVRRSSFVFRPLLNLPKQEELAKVLDGSQDLLLSEADEIVEGRVRLFGGEPVPLRLKVPGPLVHWTFFEQRVVGAHGVRPGAEPGAEEEDIKFIWEPGRFGWAYTLGRAYLLSGDERYAEAFWKYCETFLDANPVNLGPHWASGQEVALRLMAFVFADQVFAGSGYSTEQRRMRLAEAAAAHALRIPPTLTYARAQNNNHLLTEAVGLYTAGTALAEHPRGAYWRDLGWRWLNAALQSQIDRNGAYIQHSTNYHRLMLQAALWTCSIARVQGQRLPEETSDRLAAAVRWLLALCDPGSGRVPNLGPNDGADILPLSVCPFFDYRPVLQAASLAFCGERAFPPGAWDEMPMWLKVEGWKVASSPVVRREFHDRSLTINRNTGPVQTSQNKSPFVLRLPENQSWAYLRAARFTGRPGHADQLHLDLWWRGLNVAQDAGTYLYNAPLPWENSLARTEVHNTVSLDRTDQMSRAGRFLWLDWAQAQGIEWERAEDGAWERAAAQHNGYRKLGAVHRREVIAHPGDRWNILDQILRSKSSASATQPVLARLHWLLPDWEWRLEIGDWGVEIHLQSPYGPIRLRMGYDPQSLISNLHSQSPLKHQVVRAGVLIHGEGPTSPTWGWASPTYGIKIPALSISISVEHSLPIHLFSEWIFPSYKYDP